jgi:hypothetical protein
VEDVAVGFVDGDGTITAVDNVHNPSRLYGTTQFIGVGYIDGDAALKDHSHDGEFNEKSDRDEDRDDEEGDDDDDEECGGLCFVQGDSFINVPIDKYFPEPSSFPQVLFSLDGFKHSFLHAGFEFSSAYFFRSCLLVSFYIGPVPNAEPAELASTRTACMHVGTCGSVVRWAEMGVVWCGVVWCGDRVLFSCSF